MITKIALRNLTEHRSKTLIVGGLIALGVTLLVMGNSIMDSISVGLRHSFTEQYSGDIFIYAPVEDEGDLSIFGSFGTDGVQALERFDEFAGQLAAQANVQSVSPTTVGRGILETNQGEQGGSLFWGIDPTVWQHSFAQPLTWLEGGLWSGDAPSIALSIGVADALAEAQGSPIKVGETLLITVMGDNGIKIREVTISGLFAFKTIAAPQLELMSLVDLKTSQALLSLNHQQVIEVQLSAAESDILGQVTEDSLFGEATLVGAAEPDLFGNGSSLITPELSNESVVAEPIALAAHSSPGVAAHVTLPVQAQFAVLLLDNPADVAATQARLQAWVDANDLNWRVGDWTQAAGFIGNLVGGIKLILNGLVVLVAFVATLIIMNTLVISVTERLQEIGTMRAIGAQKAFVRKMILTETLILALASALVGVLVGTVALWLISINGLPAANDIIKILFGGDALYPSVSVSAVLQAVSMMTLGAVLACLYPLAIALKVSPLKAMQG